MTNGPCFPMFQDVPRLFWWFCLRNLWQLRRECVSSLSWTHCVALSSRISDVTHPRSVDNFQWYDFEVEIACGDDSNTGAVLCGSWLGTHCFNLLHNWQHPCFNRNYVCFPRKSFQFPCRRSSWTPSSSGWPTTLSRNENMQIKATTSQEVRPKVLLCMFYPPTWHPQRVIGMIWWGSVTSLLVGDGRCPRDGAGAGPGVLLQSYRAATVGTRASQSSQSSPSRPQVKACQSNIKIFQIVVQFGMMCMSCVYVFVCVCGCLCVCVFICASLRERVPLVHHDWFT